MEVVGGPWTNRGLAEGSPGSIGAGAADTNDLPLGVLGSEDGRSGRASGQNRDLHALTVEEVTQMAYVLLNASKGWVVTLGYDTDAERAHGAVMWLIVAPHVGQASVTA